MDLPPTQVFDDNDFSSTQKLFDTLQDEANKGQTQIGVLTIGTDTYPIKNGVNKIGRHPECSIILNDPTVSKNHAEIEANSGESSAWICDLHSSNKTKLNNTILRPARCYELKNESVIEFGTVRAVYKTNRSLDESLIPATPAPIRQQQNRMVIPGTPDSSLNNSSTLGDNVSIIPGTQAGDDDSKFRRPSLPLRSSTGSRKSFIQDSSLEDSINNSPSLTVHGKENVGVPRVSIHDMETQKEFESLCDTDVDIHDVETQKICMSSIRAPRNSLPAQGANIHDVETQHEEDIETQPQITNIHDLETQPQITNIHDLETQPQIINIHDLETQPQISNIHDIETQHVEDIETQHVEDIETQPQITGIHDIETQHEDVDIHDVKTSIKAGVEIISMANSNDIARDNEESKLEKQELAMKNENDICDMETQKIEVKENSPSSSDVNSHKDQETEVSGTVISVKQESVTTDINQIENAPKGSQECLQLSLATNFEDDCTEFDRSHNLIGSQNLLDILENDNSSDETKSEPTTLIRTSRPSVNKSAEKSTDDENIFDAATQVKDDSDNIFDAATQRVNCPLKASLTDDDSDDTDQEGVFQRYSRISSQDSTQPSKSQAADSDSETDEEGHFTEIAMKNRASCSFETQQNESREVKNGGGTSKDSDDLFEAPTQQINPKKEDSPIKEAENGNTFADYDMPTQVIDTKEPESSVRTEEETNVNDIYDLAPTQVIVLNESPAKINEASANLTTKKTTADGENEDITEMEDNTIQILSNPEKVSDVADDESPKINILEEYSVEDIDYEMAPTQLIVEARKEKSVSFDESGKNVSKKSGNLNFDDTLERNLNEMFDDVNEEKLGEHTQISTQVLTNVLQSSQREDKFNDNPTEDDISPNIGNAKKFSKGRKSKGQVGSPAKSGRKSLNSDLKIKTTDSDSQSSETYFSTLTSTRKLNVLGGSQDSDAPVESTSDSKKEEEVAVVAETVDLTSDKNNSVTDTSLRFTPTNSSTPRSSRRRKIEESKVCEPIAEETDLSESNKDTPTSSSKKVMDRKSVSPVRIYKLIDDDEEDIMAGLPEVRISGTFFNPVSPTSSTSNTFNFRNNKVLPKQETKRGRSKKRGAPRKSWQLVKKLENAGPYPTIPKADSPTILRNIGDVDADKASMEMHESDDEKVNKPSKRVTRKASSESLSKSRMSKSAAQQKSVPSVDTQEQAIRSPFIQSNGRTRNLIKENVDRSSVFQVGKEALVASAEPAKRSTLGSSRRGKRSLSTTDENESISAKKHKEDLNVDVPLLTRGRKSSAKNAIVNGRNSANILDYMAKRSSPMNVEISNSAKLFNQSDFSSKQLLIKVARMSPYTPTESLSPRSPTMSVPESTISNETNKTRHASVSSHGSSNSSSNGEKKKVVENVRTERSVSLRVSRRKKQAEDISSQVGEESQEVEMIMNQQFKVQTTVQREKREDTNENARGTRTRNARKRVNETAVHTDTESIASSDICESDNANFEMPTLKAKRSRVSKNASNAADSTVNEPAATRTRRNIKQPSRSTRNQQQPIIDSSIEESKEIEATQTSVNNSSRQVSTAKRRGRKPKTEKQPEEIIEETSSTDINSSFDNASVTSTPRVRRSIASSSFVTSSPLKVKHKILFTGIPSNDYNKLLTKLGASQVEDPTKCSVLVTDKVRRTIKFLCALAQSVPIVSVDWLAESEKAGHFVEWENYILKDPAAEAKFGFKLRKSLEKAKEQKLLEGYTIVLTPNVAPPPLPELKSIISSCGGKPLVRPPSSWPAKAVIISCETDLVNAKKFLVKAPKTVTLQSTEFLLTGILRQELNFDKYKLT